MSNVAEAVESDDIYRQIHAEVDRILLRQVLEHFEDNQVLASHRALATFLGAVLKLPPVKRALASKQLNSRFLEAVTRLEPNS